jgi:hypothetical protein
VIRAAIARARSFGAFGSGAAARAALLDNAHREIEAAQRAADWDRVLVASDRVLTADSSQGWAEAARRNAQAERGERRRYEQLLAAVGPDDAPGHLSMTAAVGLVNEISRDSVYRTKAEERLQALRASYVSSHLTAAWAAIEARQFDGARRHVRAVREVDPENREASAVLATSQTLEEEVSRAVEHGPDDDSRLSARPAAAVRSDRPDVLLLKRARDAFSAQQYDAAIDFARRAVTAGAGISAWRIIGVSQCWKGNRAAAQQALDRLDRSGQEIVRRACSRRALPLR